MSLTYMYTIRHNTIYMSRIYVFSICVLFSYKHEYIHVWSHICVFSCDVGRWEVLVLQCCNIKSVQSYNVNIAMPPTYRVPPLYT